MSPALTGNVNLVLAIDVGLTNCKAVLFDLDGHIVNRMAVAYETRRPGPHRVEQDPESWWRATVEAVRGLVGHDDHPSRRVTAIGVTAHMHALICLDGERRSIGPALVLGDRRATGEADEISCELGEDLIYETTGTTMDPSMPAAKIRWLWRHEPERWSKAAWFVGCKDYLRARLTGEVATEPVDACATSLYDIRSGGWSGAIAESARAPLSKLPPVCRPEAIAGFLLPEPAAELGLPAGIPIIVGAGDDVEVLGNGLLEPGSCLEHLGTTGSILAVAASATSDPARALELYPHSIAGRWILGGSMTSAGAALDWAARTLDYRSVKDASACLRAWPSALDAPVFLPNLEGARSPVREPFARGGWLGLHPDTDRADLMLAAFEGVAHGLQAILARTEALVGAGGPIAVSAGDSADPRWLQLRADVYGRQLAVQATSEPTALGLLILATAALGVDASPDAAMLRIVRTQDIVEPRPTDSRTRRRDAYGKLGDALKSVWPALASPT